MTEPSGNGGNGKRKPVFSSDEAKRRSLANLRPWPKGVSGNPKGSKPGRGLMDGIRKKLEASGGRKRKVLEDVLIQLAVSGDQRVLAMLLDRLDGPVRQELAHTIERQVKLIEGVPEDAL